MRCAKCGFSNIHGAKFCSECGSPLQMPGADRPNRSANRKVIKLPSDMSNEPTTPIERPWEVRVPKRDGATPTTPGSASAQEQLQAPIRLPRRVAEQAPRLPRARFPSSSVPQANPAGFQTKTARPLARPGPPPPAQEHGRQQAPPLRFSSTTSQQSQHPRDPLALRAIFPVLGHAAACAMTQRVQLATRRATGRGSSSFSSRCSSSAASWRLAFSSQTLVAKARR